MPRLFGTDGVRGTYGRDLTDDLARSLGAAAADVLAGGDGAPRILIGRDTRASSPALEHALARGIAQAGGRAVSLGVIPTAAVAYLVRAAGASAGAVISASHNPAEDNGIKFFGADGMKLPDAVEDAIEAAMRPVPAGDPHLEHMDDAAGRYAMFLLKDVPPLGGLRVVVDCANGAASGIAPDVYARAGASVQVIAAEPDGSNINDGCGSTHPERLQQLVRETNADVGIAHDGDADRLIAVDPAGALVDGDQVLGICAIDARARGALRNDAVVTTVMANLGFRKAMQREGIALVEAPVGDRYVLAAMLERDIVLGGEQSGHIVFLDRHTTGDGLLTALRLMGVVAETGRSLSDLATAIPRFPQVLENIRVADRTALAGADKVWAAVRAEEASLGADGRVLVRASGTEPLVRVMAEAPTEERARVAVDAVADVIRDVLG